jgi:hypothetical protein
VTTAGYATALYSPWLNQIYEAYRVRCGKAASVGGLVFSQMKSAAASSRRSRMRAIAEQNLNQSKAAFSAPPPPKPRGGPSALAGEEERAGQARCP